MLRHLPPLAIAALVTVASAAPAQFQGRIYPAPKTALSVAGLPGGATLDRVVTADRLMLSGVEVAGRADRPVILVFHGNGSSAADAVTWLAPSIASGYGVVAAEYRGYSANPGKPGEQGLAADADAFYTRAKALAGSRPVIVVGHSLGGGVALSLSRRHRLDALVTIGTFTRLRAMAPKIVRAFITDRYDNVDAARALDEPYWLVHGTADDIIPWSEGRTLAQAAANASKCCAAWILPEAGHHPDGATVAALIDVVAAHLRGETIAVPAGVKAFAFPGADTPRKD